MTNCLDNFILYKNLCRDIEPSNWIVTVLLRKKKLTACSYLEKIIWEQNKTSTIEKLQENPKKNRVWEFIADIESSNTIVIVYLKTLQLACLRLDGQLKYRFNWSRLYRKRFQLKPFDFVLVNFNKKISSQNFQRKQTLRA